MAADEKAILRCLYSRHHDGHVRQVSIGQLLDMDRSWVVPFVIKLVGEYVIEILEAVRDALQTAAMSSSSIPSTYQQFATENPVFMSLTTQRAISYWNCYYRMRFPNRFDYPAMAALAILRYAPSTES